MLVIFFLKKERELGRSLKKPKEEPAVQALPANRSADAVEPSQQD
jgi:hypothetical protein